MQGIGAHEPNEINLLAQITYPMIMLTNEEHVSIIPWADWWVVLLWFLGAYVVFMHSQKVQEPIRNWLLEQLQMLPLNHPELIADSMLVITQIFMMVFWPMFAAVSLGVKAGRAFQKLTGERDDRV